MTFTCPDCKVTYMNSNESFCYTCKMRVPNAHLRYHKREAQL